MRETIDKKFLVIDDFNNVRKSIKSMLQTLGIQEIDEADNGQRATKKISQNKYDVILCDYNLGPGKDGQQLLYELRKKNMLPFTTIYVIITAETARIMVMGALEYSPDDYLAKPFALETLKQRLLRWLDRLDVTMPVLKAKDEQNSKKIVDEAKYIADSEPRYRGWAQKQISDVLIKSGELEQAEEFLKTVMGARAQAWAQFDQARLEMARNNLIEAVTILEDLVKKYPNHVAGYDCLAECYAKLNLPEKQVQALSAGIQQSPRNFDRQKTLADVANELEDHFIAGKAYKEVVGLAENSWQESTHHYNDLLSSLTLQFDETDDPEKRKALQRTIISYSKKLIKRFPDELNQVKYMARLYHIASDEKASPEQPQTQQALKKLRTDAEANISDFNPEVTAVAARVLYKHHQFKDGDELIESLKNAQTLDERIYEKLDQLQNEPISKYAREKALELNKHGMELYEKKNFDEAFDQFTEALQYSPRHAGLVLNYVQTGMQLVKNSSDTSTSKGMLNSCQEILDRLSYISERHSQYKRYQLLCGKLKKMREKL